MCVRELLFQLAAQFQPGKREDPGDKVTAVPLFAQRWTQLIDAHFFMRGNLKLPETVKKLLKESIILCFVVISSSSVAFGSPDTLSGYVFGCDGVSKGSFKCILSI